MERAKGVSAVKAPAAGDCPACGASALARYEVLSEGGWFRVLKCQECLVAVEREPWARCGHVRQEVTVRVSDAGRR